MEVLLSIIIPYGLSEERAYIKERVLQKAQFYKDYEKVEFIFVEGYSSAPDEKLKDFILAYHHSYLKEEKQEALGAFSQGLCRNLGISKARAGVVLCLDVDYHLSKANLSKLLKLIKIKQIDSNPNAFLALPCIFLKESADEYLKSFESEFWDFCIQKDLLFSQKHIRFLAPLSSSVLMNKHKFLELGGYDDAFIGHGYEDFDFYVRLLKSAALFEKMPKDLAYDERSWQFTHFKGFRSWFKLVGQEAMLNGIYLYHFYHNEPNQNGYLDNRELNHQIFYQRLKHKNLQNLSDALQNDEAKDKKVLVFTKENSAVYHSLRALSVYLGEFICKSDVEFFDEKDEFDAEYFLKFLKENAITTLIFPNSYANEKRVQIYHFAKEKKLEFLVYDRGALADSWFFDDKGFNYDSSNYDEKIWNISLSDDELEKSRAYIKELVNSKNFLEKQGEFQSALELRKKLGIRHRKVIFVPLQVRSDSVIKHFTYEPFTWENFLAIIDSLALEFLKQDLVFVVKKHPLSLNLDKIKYKNLIFAADETNFISLIELSEAVLTLNSGVGVYALAMNKPVIVCANAFYECKNLTLKARDKEELRQHLWGVVEKKFHFDTLKALKFIYYLRFQFYSFGKSYYEETKENDRLVTRVFKIEFYELKIKNQSLLSFESVEKQHYKAKSLFYSPFNYEIQKEGNFTQIEEARFIKRVNHFAFLRKFKAFRLLKKLIKEPRTFIMDSKKPFFKPLKPLIKGA